MLSSKLNIALLCNSKMAFPAMQRMLQEGVLCSIATADNDIEVMNLFLNKANEHAIPYYKIPRKNFDQKLEEWLEETAPDMVFVMCFPWRIPVTVLSIPEFGFLNFHYGLLPEMRGADPIFESIRQRRTSAGTTVHVMTEDYDTGPILMREEVPLPAEYTYGMLSGQMAYLGEKMCTQLLQNLQENKTLAPMPQDEAKARYWSKISEAAMWIKWDDMSCMEIAALVRACNPIAKGVPAMINNWKIGVCDVSEVNLQGDATTIEPGTILAIDPQNGLLVCCKDGKALRLDVVYTGEGVFPGYKLAFFGIIQGMKFSETLVLSATM